MKLKMSDLKNLIKESVYEIFEERYGSEVDSTGKGQSSVDELFNRGSMVITFSDIEEIAYMLEKDVARAEDLYAYLVGYATELAEKLGYTTKEQHGYFEKINVNKKPETRVDDDGFVGNVELQESHKKLRDLIKETIEEVKAEEAKSVEESMKSVLRMIKEQNKSLSLKKNKAGHFEVVGCTPTQIEIRPMMVDSFDVIFIKNGTDREKKMNLNLKSLKEYLKEKITEKNLDYKQKAFNKAATQVEDETKKAKDLPSLKVNPVKSVGETKKEDMDFNKKDVENEKDLPDKPLAEVGDVKTQSSHDEDSGKAKYTFPKQSKEEKSHVVKGGKGKELKLPEKKIPKK